jgi:hypothetical protein
MRRITLAAALALLAFPGSALASRGVVLSVSRSHHVIEVVDAKNVVHAFHYRGRLPKLHAGSHVNVDRAGRVKLFARGSSTVSFYARVVRTSKHGIVLRLADGRVVTFGSKQIAHKRLPRGRRHMRHDTFRAHVAGGLGGVTINIQGLAPGVPVLITRSVDSGGNLTITITLPPPSTAGQQAIGVVGEVDTDAFMLDTPDGSALRMHMAAGALANLNLASCDTVDVTYHQDGGLLIADAVQETGTSTTGDCAGDDNEQDQSGQITAISDGSVSIDTQDHGVMTFTVDESITADFVVGDVVDVTYTQQGDGSLDASDVEYVEQEATGTVTAVSDGSMTITDDTSGQAVSFTADPSLGMFDGVALGDAVDVFYHQSAAGNAVDVVDDQNGD